eukprot:scaffold1150_cov135-Isochrysis_galbana.AAC.4
MQTCGVRCDCDLPNSKLVRTRLLQQLGGRMCDGSGPWARTHPCSCRAHSPRITMPQYRRASSEGNLWSGWRRSSWRRSPPGQSGNKSE